MLSFVFRVLVQPRFVSTGSRVCMWEDRLRTLQLARSNLISLHSSARRERVAEAAADLAHGPRLQSYIRTMRESSERPLE